MEGGSAFGDGRLMETGVSGRCDLYSGEVDASDGGLAVCGEEGFDADEETACFNLFAEVFMTWL